MDALEQRPRRAPRVLAVALTVAFVALVGWLVAIQIGQSDKLCRLGQAQQRTRTPIPPYRGSVVDARGRPMAATTQVYSIYVDPGLILANQYPEWQVSSPSAAELAAGAPAGGDNCSAAARSLAAVLGMRADEVERKLEEDSTRRFTWLKRRVDRATRDAVMALKVPVEQDGKIVERKISGIGAEPEGQRYYPAGQLAPHLLGTVGIDGQGTRGLEYFLDGRLAGKEGYRIAQVDGHSGRRPVWVRPQDYRPAVDGQLLVLTIDLTIQMFAEEALKETVNQYRAKGGSVIVMDPKTCEILAMANYPTFDPEDPGQVSDYVMRNRLLVDPYEPGSTFKCFIFPAAIEAGVVRPGESIFCHNGSYKIPGRTLRDVHPYGTLSAEMVVIKSSNIGMGIIGLRMGNKRLYEAITKFGFGERTGILLPGESPGVIKPLQKWSGLSNTSVTMGYEVLVTPLQMATAFCAIANGGTLMKPRIIKYVYGADRRLMADLSQPVAVRRVLSQKTADYMRQQVLRRVITEGTGKTAAIEGVEVFGKTGTAEKIDPATGKYSDRLHVGSFIGSAPLADPHLVVMVVIDEPDCDLGRFGGTVAAPAVKKILEKSLSYLNAMRLSAPAAPARGQVALKN